MPATITIDRKCGRYDTDCTNRLNQRERTSLSISASTIGSGKQTSSVSAPRISVLVNTSQNVGSLRNISTYRRPTQYSPKMLPPGRNRRNAMTLPSIGTYRKTRKNSSGRTSERVQLPVPAQRPPPGLARGGMADRRARPATPAASRLLRRLRGSRAGAWAPAAPDRRCLRLMRSAPPPRQRATARPWSDDALAPPRSPTRRSGSASMSSALDRPNRSSTSPGSTTRRPCTPVNDGDVGRHA